MPIARTSGVKTELDTNYFTDVNLTYYAVEILGQDLTSEAGLAGGASELIVQVLKPSAYRFKVQGGHTYFYCLIEGSYGGDDDMQGLNLKADTLGEIQRTIRGLGSAVGPNSIDLTGATVYFKGLQ